MAPRIVGDTKKSESLPVITIATPWGSYEYPDVEMPAERLVSDSPIDIKEKMRMISACIDDGSDPTEEKIIPDQSKLGYVEGKEIEISSVYRRTETPTNEELPINQNSEKGFDEAFNVLPIKRNANIGSDYNFPQSSIGSDILATLKINPGMNSKSFYNRESDSPRQTMSGKKIYDPLSQIEGELGPLQNELSEIRGKVRAMNLDYNLSCINFINDLPCKTHNDSWMSADFFANQYYPEIRPVKDDFLFPDYIRMDISNPIRHSELQPSAFEVSSHAICPRHEPFPNRSSLENSNLCSASQSIEFTIPEGIIPPQDQEDGSTVAAFQTADICGSENVKKVDQLDWLNSTAPQAPSDRNLAFGVHVCTSTPRSLEIRDQTKVEPAEIEERDDTDEAEDTSQSEADDTVEGWEKPTAPEIRLPNYQEKITIVPIAYLGEMPDPPVKFVFNFAQPGGDAIHKDSYRVLKIEHPDKPRHLEMKNLLNMSSNSSVTAITEEKSVNDRSETFESPISSNESSPGRSVGRTISNKSDKVQYSSCSRFSKYAESDESIGNAYVIRGLISRPEDFL